MLLGVMDANEIRAGFLDILEEDMMVQVMAQSYRCRGMSRRPAPRRGRRCLKVVETKGSRIHSKRKIGIAWRTQTDEAAALAQHYDNVSDGNDCQLAPYL